MRNAAGFSEKQIHGGQFTRCARNDKLIYRPVALGRQSPNSSSSGSFKLAPPATNPESRGERLLQARVAWSKVKTKPPALSTRAAPPATSHSCFGVNVKVASASPAETRANLYATEPMG